MESKKKTKSLPFTSFPKHIVHDKEKRFQGKCKIISCRFCLNYHMPLYSIPFQLWEVRDNSIIKIAQKSLALKYSQSQAFYYTKTINDYLHNEPTSVVIKLKEISSLYSVDEWMRRFYRQGKPNLIKILPLDESDEKVQLLTEYYRFHNEIPRLFMIPSSDTMNKQGSLSRFIFFSYHDKKRRIDYFKIAKQIEDENKRNPDKPPKGIVGDNPQNLQESQSMSETREQKEKKHYGNFLDDLTQEQKKNESVTLQEINQKLDEIVKGINNAGLENEMKQAKLQQNQQNDDLNKFLQYLKDEEAKKNKVKIESESTSNKLRKYMVNQPLKLQSPKSSRVNGQQPYKNAIRSNANQINSNTLFKQLLNQKNSKSSAKKKKLSFEAVPPSLKQCIQLLQQSKTSSKSKSKINHTLKTPKQYDSISKMEDIIPLSAKYAPNKQSWFPSAKQTQTKSPNQASSKIGSQTHRVTTQGTLPKSASTLNKILSPISPTMTKKELSDFFLLQIKTMKSQLSISKPKVQSVIQGKTINKRQSKGMRMSLEQIKHYHARSDFNQV